MNKNTEIVNLDEKTMIDMTKNIYERNYREL